ESSSSEGVAAEGDELEVLATRGQRVAEGRLNEQGVFVFTCEPAQPIRVVVSAGAGHRKELSISASDVDQARAGTPKDSEAPVRDRPSAAVPLAEHTSGPPIKDVLTGLGFLRAVAAFALSLRNAQKLRALTQDRRPGN